MSEACRSRPRKDAQTRRERDLQLPAASEGDAPEREIEGYSLYSKNSAQSWSELPEIRGRTQRVGGEVSEK